MGLADDGISILSGIFASLASLFTKLAVSGSGFHYILGIILSNILMWLSFTFALERCSSTIRVQVLNSAANLLTTGLASHLFLGEEINMKWMIGAIFISLGSFVLTYSDSGSGSGGERESTATLHTTTTTGKVIEKGKWKGKGGRKME